MRLGPGVRASLAKASKGATMPVLGDRRATVQGSADSVVRAASLVTPEEAEQWSAEFQAEAEALADEKRMSTVVVLSSVDITPTSADAEDVEAHVGSLLLGDLWEAGELIGDFVVSQMDENPEFFEAVATVMLPAVMEFSQRGLSAEAEDDGSNAPN